MSRHVKVSLLRGYDLYELYGWMDDLRFNVLFNSISVISGRLADGNEMLLAIELHLQMSRFRLEWDSNP